MILEDIEGFLKKVPPFQFLSEEELRAVAMNMTIDFYPAGSLILKQDGPAGDALRIIRRGGVKIWIETSPGHEVVIDFRGEGETFGFLSLVGRDRERSNATAVVDTECYLLGKEQTLRLLHNHLSFTEHFLTADLAKYIDRTYKEMQDRLAVYSGSDRLLFSTRVGDVASKEVVTASVGISIKEAAQIMSRRKVSSIVLLDEHGVPAGIVTDRDLRGKVVATGMDMDRPVSVIMSAPLIRVDARDYCYEAVLKMVQFNIHHVLVVSEGRLSGIITNHDLMMLQGTSPLSLTKDIEHQQTIEGLAQVSQRVNGVIGLLLKEGARAGNIMQVIAEINDRLVRRVVEITERRLGQAPVPYCWIAYGSEGRKEQTFKTDQDNALIYADPKDKAEAEAASSYFAQFSESVNDSLIALGFPPCPGEYMAKNEAWRRPVSDWKRYFSDWIYAPTSDAILYSVILFDFRPIYGDFSLAEALRAHLLETASGQDIFFKHMADIAISLRPPLGFFKTFVVEKSGEHKNELNLKTRCIAPIVDIVRLAALEEGVAETSTLERITLLKQRSGLMREYGDELTHSFEFLSLLRIHNQLGQIESGKEPDNFINPDMLSGLERGTLKNACRIIGRVQDSLAKKYNPGSMM